jgi:hypothetical protein
MQGAAGAVCVTYHASEDVREARDVEPSPRSGEAGKSRSYFSAGAGITSIHPTWHTVHRTVRHHARVEVWLE